MKLERQRVPEGGATAKALSYSTFKRLLNQSMFMCGDCKPIAKVA